MSSHFSRFSSPRGNPKKEWRRQKILKKKFKSFFECFWTNCVLEKQAMNPVNYHNKMNCSTASISPGDLVLFQFLPMIALVFNAYQLLSVDELPIEQLHFHIWLNSDYITCVYHSQFLSRSQLIIQVLRRE